MRTMVMMAGVVLAMAATGFAAQFPKAEDVVAEFKKAAAKIEEVEKGKTMYYVVRDASNKVVQVAYLKIAQGYKGKITMFAIAKLEGGAIVYDSIRIVDGADKYKERTNGQEGKFMEQFVGKAADKETKEMKLGIDSISQCTVTARSIKRAIDSERSVLLQCFGIGT